MRTSEAAASAYKVLMGFCYGQAGPRRGFHRVRLLIGKFRYIIKLQYKLRIWSKCHFGVLGRLSDLDHGGVSISIYICAHMSVPLYTCKKKCQI